MLDMSSCTLQGFAGERDLIRVDAAGGVQGGPVLSSALTRTEM